MEALSPDAAMAVAGTFAASTPAASAAAAPAPAPAPAPTPAAAPSRNPAPVAVVGAAPVAAYLSAVQWERCKEPQTLYAETARKLFPGYKVGEQISGAVVLPDGRELPLELGRSSCTKSFVCGDGWAAVCAAMAFHLGQKFGTFPPKRGCGAGPRWGCIVTHGGVAQVFKTVNLTDK